MQYDQVSEVQIHLQGEALRSARRAIRKQHGWLAAWRFQGPHFKAALGMELYVAIGSSTANVGIDNADASGEYIYPLANVGRIKTVALN